MFSETYGDKHLPPVFEPSAFVGQVQTQGHGVTRRFFVDLRGFVVQKKQTRITERRTPAGRQGALAPLSPQA